MFAFLEDEDPIDQLARCRHGAQPRKVDACGCELGVQTQEAVFRLRGVCNRALQNAQIDLQPVIGRECGLDAGGQQQTVLPHYGECFGFSHGERRVVSTLGRAHGQHARRLPTVSTGASGRLMYINWLMRRGIIMNLVGRPRSGSARSQCALFSNVRVPPVDTRFQGGSLVQDEPVSHDLPSGDPLNDPGVTKMVADIAQATHSGEDAVRALYVSAYETLNRDARIFCFVPLLAEKRVRKILQKHACRAR